MVGPPYGAGGLRFISDPAEPSGVTFGPFVGVGAATGSAAFFFFLPNSSEPMGLMIFFDMLDYPKV